MVCVAADDMLKISWGPFWIVNEFSLLTILRIASVLAGFFLILASSLLYETEDKQLQNKLDSLWIRLSDVETAALSRQAKFVRAVSVLTDKFFDAFLGHKFVSVRSLGVSACLSMASLTDAFLLLSGYDGHPHMV